MRTRWQAVRRAGATAALVAVLAALAYCAWFRVEGGRWERVESPSMGTAAPVGTLLWVRAVDVGVIRTGDVVSFHRPGSGARGEVYSHRVTRTYPDGSFTTAGDLSGPDEWRVAPSDVVGRAVHVWPGVGWLVLAAPVLVIGGCMTVALARRNPRLPIARLGVSLTLSVAIMLYHPLAGVQSLGADRTTTGMRATFVSTGVLPVRLTTPGGPGVVLRAGQSGSVVSSRASGPPQVGLHPVLPWWCWLLLVTACFAPALWSSLLGPLFAAMRPRRRRPQVGLHQALPA